MLYQRDLFDKHNHFIGVIWIITPLSRKKKCFNSSSQIHRVVFENAACKLRYTCGNLRALNMQLHRVIATHTIQPSTGRALAKTN